VPVVSTTAPQRIVRPIRRDHACHPAILNQQVFGSCGQNRQVRLKSERSLHRLPIELAISLGARSAHGGTLAPVEQTKLDAGRVRHAAHHAIHGVDLADQMPLADPADCRIAGHLADRLELVRQRAAVRRPRVRAAAAAASQPACPPPITINVVAHGRGV
jgi:hypothetical protein